MSFWKKTIRDINLDGKRVLVRADYSVPLDEHGHITDDYRIKQSLPTIKYLLDHGCKVIICSHLGRPKDEHDKHCSLAPVANYLDKALDHRVHFAIDCVGPAVEDAARDLSLIHI